MTSRYLFLLVYLLGSCLGASSAQRNETCRTSETCGQMPDSTTQFLQCVGLPSTDTGTDHMRRLKSMLEATMDVYTFMRSSMTGVPILSLQGELEINPDADPLQNEALVQMWLEVKIRPLLKSITRHFLSCLSTKNFSCTTYQTVVRDLSLFYSEMDPVRQQWIYTFFMYPFLSRYGLYGCVIPGESSEEWLMKNFGAFRAMARMKDLSTLNMVFSGLEVLHLLSPAQKAELLMMPEVASLDNGTLSLVFHNLLTGNPNPPPISPNMSWSTPAPRTLYPRPPPQNGFRGVVNGFMTAFRPIGSFVHNFVSFASERDVSEIRSATLTQFLLNWTLSELADMYRPQNTSVSPGIDTTTTTAEFDVTNMEDWYLHVVMPVLRRFLPNDQNLMDQNIKLAFQELFFLGNRRDNETEIQDVCSITLDGNPCGLTNAVQNVARVLSCAARTNLTLTEATVMRLIMELTERLNSLIQELSTANFTEVASDLQQIFDPPDSPALAQQHLQDPDFIKLWFPIKLMPLLPNVPPALLSCLSMNNFSCPAFQTIVAALSRYMSFMDTDPMYSRNIYELFILPFLQNNNTADPQCLSSANSSAEWLQQNFGFFSRFASVVDFYRLNPDFNGLDVLPVLTPKQLAELLLLPLPTPPEKDVVIDGVFDFLERSPEIIPEVIRSLVRLASEVNPPCEVFRQILTRLSNIVPSLSFDFEPVVSGGINQLISVVPDVCVPENATCQLTQFNATNICRRVDSSQLQSQLDMWPSMGVPCNFTLEQYACAQLQNFTAKQLTSLLMCNLPGNSSRSVVLWKLLLTRLSDVLDPALDMLANMSMPMVGPSASVVLDVIGELRLLPLTDEQLMNSSVIRRWFSERLSPFLPSASGAFLFCLSRRNLSCQAYQQILQAFIQLFDNMTMKQQRVVVDNFIVRVLSRPTSGAGCVNASADSAEWLRRNLGPFAALLSLRELLDLDRSFNPLDALRVLTPKQSAELLLLNLPVLPDRDEVINAVLDYLTEPAQQQKIPEFLFYLVMFLERGNLSCSSFRTLFGRLDLAMMEVSLEVASNITYAKIALSKNIPPGCIVYSGECNVTMTNETDICIGVDSSMLQLQLNSGKVDVCNFSVEQFACASLSALTAEDLSTLLMCNRSSNSSSGSRPVWILLLSKASNVLDRALDLLSNKTLDPTNPVLTVVLDALREIRLDAFNVLSFGNSDLIQLWFNRLLRPFLPAVSPDFLSCLTTKGLTCATYQDIVEILSRAQPRMTRARQMFVYTHFIRVFLTRNATADRSCSLRVNNSGEWLQRNLGGFSVLASFLDLQMLYPNFTALEALPQLTVRQLAEVSASPGQLTSAAQVNMVMRHVPSPELAAFFDDFSPAIVSHGASFPSVVRSAMLQVVFDRANLSDDSVNDTDVRRWLLVRLRPLLINLSPRHVAPFFGILAGRNCSLEQQGIEDLNATISSLNDATRSEVFNHIVLALTGPTPLRCYSDQHSFYGFLQQTFLSFQFPNLTTFLLLIPPARTSQLVSTMSTSELADFLRRPDVVDNDAQLCVLYNSYNQTPVFLESESLPESVQRPTLPCVWPVALSSSTRPEVNAWFDRRLPSFLPFLTRPLISPSFMQNASCLAFQRVVPLLGGYNYTAVDFGRADVYDTIRSYLTLASGPRCYDPNDPDLNSTAWFVQYIGFDFIPFLTLDDLQLFGSEAVIQTFTVNPLNLALFNQSFSTLPQNLTNFCVQLIYQQDPNFNPLILPLGFRCVAPGPAFTQLNAAQSMVLLSNLTTLCTDLDPQISSALAGNLGDSITSSSITALGSQSVGFSTGQIRIISPQDLFAALSTLSGVTGWNGGQARAIIQALLSSGLLQLNSVSSLTMIGSLVMGLPTTVFSSISVTQLITVSSNPAFVTNLIAAPVVIRQVFVRRIVSVTTTSTALIQNIPDDLATEIPRARLQGFSSSNVLVLNRKRWKRQQAQLFFSVMGTESATTSLGTPDSLSSSVLQGFSCTTVRTISRRQIRRLIRACRRSGINRVTLVETQLTCMYNYIRVEPDVASFNLYPPDMLLYYDYAQVPQVNCRSYFQQLATADFFVFSRALRFKRDALLTNARSCLGITTNTLTQDNIQVLGNMCCVVDGSFIENSDSSILNVLGSCRFLTRAQGLAAQKLLLSGNTQFGAPSTWDIQTLRGLGTLPLYLTSDFYVHFNKNQTQFLEVVPEKPQGSGVGRRRRRRMKREIRDSNRRSRSKRSTVNECTVGNITQVTISDEAFPFDYDDVTQFNCCLSVETVVNNLDAITSKVDEEEYLQIVLSKLHEAYATSSVPEDQVQLLGAAARVATVDNIDKWNITQLDTLSALMDSSDGEWDPSLAKAIITKYLRTAGNMLGSTELDAIGGVNLCSLDVGVLSNITADSLRDADALDVTNCTLEQKRLLFVIARAAFNSATRTSTVSVRSYQLTQPFVGGADLDYVRCLAISNVSMDLATFNGLDEDVVLSLTVAEVRGLLGTNLEDLKDYENETLVNAWIRSQLQSELDTLDVGLVGGRNDPTTAAPSGTTAAPSGTTQSGGGGAATTTAAGAAATTTTNTTTGDGVRVRADVGLSFLLLLTLFVTSQHIVM